MQVAQVLDDAFARIPGVVHPTLDGLDVDALTWQPDPQANPIGWLVWHLSRVQDDHVAELAGDQQVWGAQGWAPHFGLDEGTTETGFGHRPEQVRAVQPDSAAVLLDYLDEVTDHTRTFLATLGPGDLDRIIDTSWDPPVTMGVRLVSVIGDSMQHAGQAAYLRGLYERRVEPTR
ncbi:MAG: mycothiol transferase [Nitriliruptoraceae bacterium]